MHKSPHIREFSKNSQEYQKYNFLQKKVAKHLLTKVKHDKKTVLDLGCGSGMICSLLKNRFESFVGIDFSSDMLKLHPKDKKIKVLEKDFDKIKPEFYRDFDLVLSSSSLQWSKDTNKVIQNIQQTSKNFAIAIFCDGTFKSLRDWFGVDTFLPSSKEIISILDSDTKYEKKSYTLEFNDALSQLRYIKKSGVSGGIKKLSVQSVRDFINNYQNKVLEFEVLFIWSKNH